MAYEVEQKFVVPGFSEIERELGRLHATLRPAVAQVDQYLAHPSRDFAETDEAFRIRTVGTANFVTYKGPRIDATTKTRREIELPLPAGPRVAAEFAGLFAELGFRPVGQVRKQRRTAQLSWRDRSVEIALDDVERLGTFVELELAAEQDQLDAAKACLNDLAAELKLSVTERRSYLELLLDGA